MQNFNENLSIWVMLWAYAQMIKADFSVNTIIVMFGFFISIAMAGLYYRHKDDVERV